MVEGTRDGSKTIGFQDVDRLKPSAFLLKQAKANIYGKISCEEVSKWLEEYYNQKPVREKDKSEGTFHKKYIRISSKQSIHPNWLF